MQLQLVIRNCVFTRCCLKCVYLLPFNLLKDML